jgi:hypothetical protein
MAAAAVVMVGLLTQATVVLETLRLAVAAVALLQTALHLAQAAQVAMASAV